MTDSLLRKFKAEVRKARRALATLLAMEESSLEDGFVTDDERGEVAEMVADTVTELRRRSGRAVINYIKVDRFRPDRRELDN
jgi:hypothetical protein